MRSRSITASLALIVATTACEQTQTASFETDDQKASYAIGLGMGRQLETAGDHVDMAAFQAGISDAMSGAEQRFTDDELQAAMTVFNQTLQAEQMAKAEEEGRANAEAGAAFLAENGAREGVMTTESGLQYEVIREGDGPSPQPSDRVTVHYRGTLIDGTEFDASYGGDPATFSVGGVIQGFSEGLQLMTVGSHYRFYIPGELGYGQRGSAPQIGPNATLIFDLELIEIPE